jgi:hypothetical protein
VSPFTRRLLVYLAATAVVAGAVVWGLSGHTPRPAKHTNLPQPEAAPSITDADAGQADHVQVTAVRGTVEYADVAGGNWKPLLPGIEVAVDDSLRTADGASAELRVGERSTIEVAERSELTVREITRSVHRFKLTRGRLSADYAADGTRVLRVEGTDGAIVETRQGRVGVMRNESAVAVAAKSGSATLRSAGKTVKVGPGRQAVAPTDQPPKSARPIPIHVLLRVAHHKRPLPGDRTALVRGTTAPGTRVRVNGIAADIGTDGAFEARIPVRVGRNRVVAVVEDALGRSERKVLPSIVIEPRGHVDDLTIQWGRTGGS